MSHNSPEEIHKSVKRYLMVFGALIVGTLVTVGVNFLNFGSMTTTIAVALFIASIKGFLVAAYFMHLISERKMIYSILIATVFFFASLMYLTVWSMEPTSLIHIKQHVP